MTRLIAAIVLGFYAVVAGLPAGAQSVPIERIVLPTDVTPDHYDIIIVPDLKALTFTGKVRIDVTVHRATDRIVLNEADIVIDRAALSGEAAAPTIAYDSKVETATFDFGHRLKPGHYSLAIDYRGKIFQQASGLFALDYQTPAGKRQALFTQFENSDARRFVPSWDEPGRKATFTLTVTAPANLMAISNMPVAQTTSIGGGLQTVRFTETPKMSSYLLFFGLGDFERVHQDVGGVDVGVVVKRGDTVRAAFALDAATHLLTYYNDYFGKPYPLPKLDLIAGPGSSQFFGAMENWGAIFYFERDLLIDPRVSTQSDRQQVYITVAHEMAHQWFGDLVTMAWWDDLWLNEGFASWMENKATDHFHPEWNLSLQELGAREVAMQTDARDGAHPVINPIKDVLQAGGAFDEITYLKGAAVIRMLEAYVGADNFRAGVRRYIADHAYGNTVTDDLWREIDPVSPGRPIAAIAHAFTLQPGVPLITEQAGACDNGRTRLTLAERRFATDATARTPTTWPVPVTAAVLGGAAGPGLVGPDGGKIGLAGCGPTVLNAGQTGYFRVRYRPEDMAALTARFSDLASIDQLGLLNDTRALAYNGDAPMTAFLNLTLRPDARTDPIVWVRVANDLGSLDHLYDGLPGQAKYRAYARGVLAPALAATGWDRQPDESDNQALMREAVLAAMGQIGDPALVAEARRRFAAFRQNPSSLSAASRRTMLAIVAQHADAADWEQLHQLAKTAPSELERQEFYDLAGMADDPALAQRALDLALSGEPPKTAAPDMVASVAGRHPALALAFASTHWDQLSAMLEPDTRPGFAPRLASSGHDPAIVDQLTDFAARNIPADARQDVRKAIAAVLYQAEVRKDRLPEVDRWLATR